MNITHEVIANKINGSKPPKHMATTLEDSRNADMDTKVKTVIEILESLGHCPVTKLVEAAQSQDLNPHQQAAVNKWLMEHAHAKPKTVELTGKGGGPLALIVTQEDAGLL